MKYLLRVIAGFLGVALLVGLGWCLNSAFGQHMTTSRLSPDETLRASLVERSGIDRNFEVRLENLVDGEASTIFRSPDEGGPFGTERLIWSKDGMKLLLVGRHFFVREDLFLDNGDQLYFLYDVPRKQGWWNSEGLTITSPLKAEMVEGVEFTEPVVLKTR